MGLSLDGLTTARRALPPEAPLAMPAQDLRRAPSPGAPPASSPRGMAWRRALVLGGGVRMARPAAFAIRLKTWLAMHDGLRTSRRYRAVYDALAAGLTDYITAGK
jgi:hypothetical protein